ncbi:carbohydrate ABC transporter permease [Alloscardovia venturai]|uniref:Carbohydrate ABC transporter permease n=1 Tax=Alloscardovia venturai TaxID=1769421 RepID=A0ABW2Y6K6_9BIFI
MESSPSLFTKHLSVENFMRVLSNPRFAICLKNSVIVVAIAVVLSTAVSFLACSALVLYRLPHRRILLFVILVIQMIPASVILIPQFIIFNRLGLLDSYAGLSIAYVALTLPFSIWNLKGFFGLLPKVLIESARVEGASEWQILTQIVFPLVSPGIISTAVVTFINAWNDYLIAYTFMKSQANYTLPVWLASFTTPTGVDFGAQMAASVLFACPVVIFFTTVRIALPQVSFAGVEK